MLHFVNGHVIEQDGTVFESLRQATGEIIFDGAMNVEIGGSTENPAMPAEIEYATPTDKFRTKALWDQFSFNVYVKLIATMDGTYDGRVFWQEIMPKALAIFGVYDGAPFGDREIYRAVLALCNQTKIDGVVTLKVKSVSTLRKFILGGWIAVLGSETAYTDCKSPARKLHDSLHEKESNIKAPTKNELTAQIAVKDRQLDEKDAEIARLRAENAQLKAAPAPVARPKAGKRTKKTA